MIKYSDLASVSIEVIHPTFVGLKCKFDNGQLLYQCLAQKKMCVKVEIAKKQLKWPNGCKLIWQHCFWMLTINGQHSK